MGCVDNHMRLVRRILALPGHLISPAVYAQDMCLSLELLSACWTKDEQPNRSWPLTFRLMPLPFAIIMGHAVNGFRGQPQSHSAISFVWLKSVSVVCVCVCGCECVIAPASHHAATEPQLTWWQHDNVSHRIAWHTTTRTWTRTRTGTRTSN